MIPILIPMPGNPPLLGLIILILAITGIKVGMVLARIGPKGGTKIPIVGAGLIIRSPGIEAAPSINPRVAGSITETKIIEIPFHAGIVAKTTTAEIAPTLDTTPVMKAVSNRITAIIIVL